MDKRAFLQRNKNYLFVKRFTSKEEHRRLQCGIYLGSDLPEYEWISTQNKVNFIDGNHDLTDAETYGLFVLFNSRWYDLYYRVLNGSTQVNATEMNQIPVPSLPDIRRMGLRLLKKDDLSEDRCDEILKSYLNEQYQENASFAFKDRFAERATV
jgi:adenine-specific DNA-methyltransferase